MSSGHSGRRDTCYLCQGETRLIDPPEDIKTYPGIPRWVCFRCGHFWIPSDEEIRSLGLKVPTKREREKWGRA